MITSEEKVIEHYKELKGQSRGDAIVKYMSIIEKQPTYGVHFYETKVSETQNFLNFGYRPVWL